MASDLGQTDEVENMMKELGLREEDLRWMVVGSVRKPRRRPGGLAAVGIMDRGDILGLGLCACIARALG